MSHPFSGEYHEDLQLDNMEGLRVKQDCKHERIETITMKKKFNSNKTKVHRDCKKLINEGFKVKLIDFEAKHLGEKRRVYMADVTGLDHTTHPGCHVNLDLYYETHKAMMIPFATAADAWAYVDSQGKEDNRIVHKEAKKIGYGWNLKLKNELAALNV